MVGPRRSSGVFPCSQIVCSIGCAAAFLTLADGANAQTEDAGIWLGVTVTGALPRPLSSDQGSWRVWMDGQLRFGEDASRFSQGIVRPGIGYGLPGGWTVWAGYAYVETEPPYARSNTTEHRIWEQVSWSRPIGATAVSSRTRVEQRFLSSGRDIGWRVRELAKLTRPLGSRSIWSAVVYDEYFLNVNSTDYGATSGSDRNRAFIGGGVRLSAAALVEIGYLNQYTFGSNGPDKNDHLFATNLFWNF